MIPKVAVDVIYDLWPMLILFSTVLITLRIIYLKTNHKKLVLYRELMGLCFAIYILLLFELVTSTDFNSYSNNFIPFKEIFRYELSSNLFYRNVIGNVIIFIPFGYFTSYYCRVNRFYINMLIAFITSFTIEIIQSLIGRSFDIDDILLNLAGGLLGYVVYWLSKKIFKRLSISFKNNFLLNIICIVLMLILCYIILSIYGVVI